MNYCLFGLDGGRNNVEAVLKVYFGKLITTGMTFTTKYSA